jgi:hypothetical protein
MLGNKGFRIITILAAIMLLGSVFVGCSSGSDEYATEEYTTTDSVSSSANRDMDESYDEAAMDVMEAPETAGEALGNQAKGQGADLSDRKIIETRDIYMETLDFDITTRNVESLVYNNLGYIESSNVSGLGYDDGDKEYNPRYAHYTLRVPAEYYEGFVETLLTYGYVTNNNVNMQDVTAQFLDLEARIETLTIQEERLLALLDQSARLEDILELERELADVRYDIESYTTYLNELDNRVSFSTVYLEVREVFEIKEIEEAPVTFGERVGKGFKDAWEGLVEGLEDFVVWFANSVFGIIIWLVVLYILFRIIKFS